MTQPIPDIEAEHYNYPLPNDLISFRPSKNRECSRLLVNTDGNIEDALFNQIDKFLPNNAILIYNEAKVIKARLFFKKSTGAHIEIFCLEPSEKKDPQIGLADQSVSIWTCIVGNAKKWKNDPLEMTFQNDSEMVSLKAEKLGVSENGHFLIRFSWSNSNLTFADVLMLAGRMPLPPYIQREADKSDDTDYQTVYARSPGSVAAPTAGLHFTHDLIEKLKTKGIDICRLTLHVGAGTFKPVNGSIKNHHMHTEMVEISSTNLQSLYNAKDRPWIAVGTTSLRALESLYQLAQIDNTGQSDGVPSVPQWSKFEINQGLSRSEAIKGLIDRCGTESLLFNTSLFIVPGTQVLTADYLITNFHQPCSTLLMLVDAFASVDWRTTYQHAINKKYHFLSYGDACLFKNRHSNL